jgi:hypothetical protein
MKKTASIIAICLAGVTLLFATTDPSKVLSPILIVPFLLIFISLWSFVSFVLQQRGMTKTKSTRVGGLCAGIPLLMLILQSIGQLTLRDILTIAALFSLSYFYISRTTVSS